jgi:hypothetical protein
MVGLTSSGQREETKKFEEKINLEKFFPDT